nr:RRXRR domain-containing protein [Desulfobacter hydrogenophilus]
MPTNPANARILLKQGKAKVIQRTPFAVQLLYETTAHIQPVTVGIDDGGIHVGIAAVSHMVNHCFNNNKRWLYVRILNQNWIREGNIEDRKDIERQGIGNQGF